LLEETERRQDSQKGSVYPSFFASKIREGLTTLLMTAMRLLNLTLKMQALITFVDVAIKRKMM
jgi:hypothetical protein